MRIRQREQIAQTTGDNSPAINIFITSHPFLLGVAVLFAAAALIAWFYGFLSAPASPKWDKVVPSKLAFGLTGMDFVKSYLGEPNQSAPTFSIFDKDGCQISIIHTTDVTSPTMQTNTVLAAIVSNGSANSDCDAVVRAPFEMTINGSAIGEPNEPLRDTTFEDFGVLRSIDTNDDPLRHPFHCEPLLKFVGDYPKQLIRLRDDSGYIMGVTCLVHQNFGSLGRYEMQVWLRVPEISTENNPLVELAGQLRQNYLVTHGCYVDCHPTDFQRTQYYTDLTLNDVLHALAPDRVDGVGFFPRDFDAGRFVSADSCPGSYCGSLRDPTSPSLPKH